MFSDILCFKLVVMAFLSMDNPWLNNLRVAIKEE
jgi:hypothetical protein